MNKEISIYDVDVSAFQSPVTNSDVVVITWNGNIGFGEYTLYYEGGKWHGDSEYMDKGEDKEFLKKLLEKFVENIVIDE